VGTCGADREHLADPPGKENRLFPDPPDQHSAVRKITLRDPIPEVRPIGSTCIHHMTLPETASGAASTGCRLAAQKLLQHYGVIVRLIVRGVDQRHWPGARGGADFFEELGPFLQLGHIALAKFRPALETVPKPSPQLGAGS